MPNATWTVTVDPSSHDATKFGWVLRRNGKLYQSSGAAFATRQAAELMAGRVLANVAHASEGSNSHGRRIGAQPLPWHEITTDNYYPRERRALGAAAEIEASRTIYELLSRQQALEFRLRLVLRETHDLKPGPGRDPISVSDYEIGPSAVLSAAEVVMETKDGRRHLMARNSAPEAKRSGAS